MKGVVLIRLRYEGMLAIAITAFLYLVNQGNEFCGDKGRPALGQVVPALSAVILAGDALAALLACIFDRCLRARGVSLRVSPVIVLLLMLAFCYRLPEWLFPTWLGCLFTEGYGLMFQIAWWGLLAIACMAREMATVVAIEKVRAA